MQSFIVDKTIVKSALDGFFRRVRGAAANIMQRNKSDDAKVEASLKQLQLAAEKEFLAELPRAAKHIETQERVRNVVWDMIESEYQLAYS